VCWRDRPSRADGKPAEARYNNEAMQSFLPSQERQQRIVKALRKVSEEIGRSPARIALAWLRYRDIPVIPIIGARKLAQFEDNLASLEVELTREQVARLDEASAIELGFPHDFFRRDMVRALIYGGMRERVLA
jgi:aryl-alcohol dehydrogenase-like predicted oxidoreductase